MNEMPSTRLGDHDLHLFNEGTHCRLYEKLGAHPETRGGVKGAWFGVWAPNAERVSVVGDFNGWKPGESPLTVRGSSGIWEGFVAGAVRGACYKYQIDSRHAGYRVQKADPFAVWSEPSPRTASVIWDLDYRWGDAQWMAGRARRNTIEAPMSIYEVHFASWAVVAEEGNRPLTYREMAPRLAQYCARMGYTHVELLPIMEHPFGGSWGYQVTGYFAPTSRFGTPQDFMHLVDTLHQHDIGVILDWVPAHFPTDEHGLAYFDGTHLYEHADPRQGQHPDWKTCIPNYARHEVRSFLSSSAIVWLDRYHVDGLRVDGVASMLYLDYSRKDGEWIPNAHGGRESLAAIGFLRQVNEAVYASFPDVQTIAEESTAWPMVSRPTYLGGLGFGLKWDMGWMHDTLKFMSRESIHRKFHHNELTFRGLYAFHENFVLPLSHDEVVHGKGSLVGKMPGDEWQKLANLRLLFTYMWAQAGKKLLFMGGDFAQWNEWSHEGSLDWHLTQQPGHSGMQELVAALNRHYREQPALHELDCDPGGFEWIDANDSDNSVLLFLRRARDPRDQVVVALSFTPVVRENYRVGVSVPGRWNEILNSDAIEYGGSGQGNLGGVDASPVPFHGRPHSINLRLPPLGGIYLKPAR